MSSSCLSKFSKITFNDLGSFEIPVKPFFQPPLKNNICDKCGSQNFYRRPDDNADTVRTRLDNYDAQTLPLLPYYAENFGMIRWEKPKSQTDTLFLAEKNCTAVSHEIAHELLRQSRYKRYIEDVHDTWQQHLFEAIPFEQYGEDFELTSKKPSFLTLDTTMFEKKS